jgi:hypothetical protein
MQESIFINQFGAIDAGFNKLTDLVDWAIIDYVSKNTHINYSKLINDMLILGLKSKSAVSKRISRLLNLGLIDKKLYSDREAFESLYSGHKSGCVFCGSDSSLERHHYPVRQKDSGVNTISLCASCHRLFHLLTDFGIFTISNVAQKAIGLVQL